MQYTRQLILISLSAFKRQTALYALMKQSWTLLLIAYLTEASSIVSFMDCKLPVVKSHLFNQVFSEHLFTKWGSGVHIPRRKIRLLLLVLTRCAEYPRWGLTLDTLDFMRLRVGLDSSSFKDTLVLLTNCRDWEPLVPMILKELMSLITDHPCGLRSDV